MMLHEALKSDWFSEPVYALYEIYEDINSIMHKYLIHADTSVELGISLRAIVK